MSQELKGVRRKVVSMLIAILLLSKIKGGVLDVFIEKDMVLESGSISVCEKEKSNDSPVEKEEPKNLRRSKRLWDISQIDENSTVTSAESAQKEYITQNVCGGIVKENASVKDAATEDKDEYSSSEAEDAWSDSISEDIQQCLEEMGAAEERYREEVGKLKSAEQLVINSSSAIYHAMGEEMANIYIKLKEAVKTYNAKCKAISEALERVYEYSKADNGSVAILACSEPNQHMEEVEALFSKATALNQAKKEAAAVYRKQKNEMIQAQKTSRNSRKCHLKYLELQVDLQRKNRVRIEEAQAFFQCIYDIESTLSAAEKAACTCEKEDLGLEIKTEEVQKAYEDLLGNIVEELKCMHSVQAEYMAKRVLIKDAYVALYTVDSAYSVQKKRTEEAEKALAAAKETFDRCIGSYYF
ncbi:hypothetical protein NEAUS04_1662 [Nematocida ausubeli]|uniref:Uncharacterized protein n=1 Tax=Nematocida ausubeli (strain ATCC PRA-371 / ERTm2) TaxID=1913371 RepID=A0A086J447_NEMA1|nr:uncharacterized protein NESG_01071 [Nematocida ausubeli]KAI5132345.1 hypothetical protein NEAUS07_0107 [Nematocida ausubeli]KAI5146999.1 hypothetical protein NEAUS05_0331 [Nematocida ausubeli]KAI5163559.1 hypothetical protein NEAUS04_1662 [Nematocida ausubeli]KFG26915.1 hypothetical protein NESG_01071 [Nematocida ausubeli]